ncbi:hypothetical protein P9112_008770 [Eukaryota sp. TZLM1-RC]
MNIVACCIARTETYNTARKATILTTYEADKSSQYSSLMERLLETRLREMMSITSNVGSLSYAQLFFHFMMDSDIVFLLCSRESIPLRLSSAVLRDLQAVFLQNCAQSVKTASSGSLNPVFRPIMKSKFSQITSSVDALSQTREDLNRVKGVLTENVSKLMNRGEDLGRVTESTQLLSYGSRSFNTRSRKMARRAGMGACCTTFLVILFICFILMGVFMYFCGLKLQCITKHL